MEHQKNVDRLLKITLQGFAAKIGLAEAPEPLTLAEIASVLNYANLLSMKNDSKSKSDAVVLCGLISEILPKEAIGAVSYMSQILLRIGLVPTAKMLQRQFDSSSGINGGHYLPDLGSYLDNVLSSFGIHANEVSANKTLLRLTEFQKRVWDAMENHSSVGVSAPTSAGKSFVICARIISSFATQGGTVIYIVPTISLVNQVSRDLSKMAKDFGVDGVRILKSLGKNRTLEHSSVQKTIYVVTQERASAFFEDKKSIPVIRPLSVIVDEVQNIEQTGTDSNERAMLLLEVIQQFIEHRPEKFLVSGPRLANLESVLSSWVIGADSYCAADKTPAVVNVSYSFRSDPASDEDILISQYIEGFGTRSIAARDRFSLRSKILDRVRYNSHTHEFLENLTSALERDGGSLIFAKSSNQAFKTACELSMLNGIKVANTASLVDYAKKTVHPLYGLASCLEKGIAYHHGKVPHHMRNSVESAFSSGLIKKLVCTTTLMQGVNLPAKNIIIRNPDLTTERKLSEYEFTNLRGRAGRLMKDFVGRAILVDENSFANEEINLDQSSNKELDFTYGNKFDSFKSEVVQILDESRKIQNAEAPAAELSIYVKQLIYKLELVDAERKLNSMGIFVPTTLLKKIKSSFASLKVPREIILANPFWDPSDLNFLYELVKSGSIDKITRNPLGRLKKDLESAAVFMNKNFSFYAEKYFNVSDTGRLGSVCSFAAGWVRGTPLRELIDPVSWPVQSAKDVEDRIAFISGKIPFGMTKLLKPLVELQDSENRILTYLESGCFRGEHRALIGLGLAREVTLRSFPEDLFDQNVKDDTEEDLDLQQLLDLLWRRKDSAELSPWDRLQIDETIRIEDV